jgi:hypothetical protein
MLAAAVLAIVTTFLLSSTSYHLSSALSISSHRAALILLRNLYTLARYFVRASCSATGNLKEGYLVKRGNIGIRGSGGGNKGRIPYGYQGYKP